MKASKASIGRAVDQPDPQVRFYLFHGPDEAQSRALGARVLDALGASKFLIAADTIKSDPASLADEAGALSLFGGFWLQPRLKDLHAIKYSAKETPERRRAAADTFKTWHGISQMMNLFVLLGLGVHLCRVASRGEDARFLDAGKLRS